MTQKKSTKPKAQWSEEEVDVLLTYLQLQVAKITVTTFKDETFNEAAQKIAEHHAKKGLRNQDAAKDMAQCKGKWSRSGCHWDNINGANIQGDSEAEELQWNQYINASNSNKAMKSFKNKGWRYWLKMLEILPNGSSTQGVAAYNPASLATAAANAEASGSSFASGLEAAVVPQVGWDQIESAAGSSMNMPPPPSSVAPSTTSKCTHSDTVLSTSATQSMASPMGPPNVDKKPRLLTHSSSNIARSHKSSKAAKDATSTVVFMNLQGSLNRLTDSLHMSASNTDENDTWVSEERVQAMNFMQEEDDISDDEQITLMNVFSRSPSICSVYLAAKPEKWVRYLKSVLAQAARGEFSVF
ncbi:hypothetical protein F4604DRAFT_1913811 [Suillus subluteus]|nr:hypothetical protein F4604DRAFT_1913811 [Suillus subluteus]